MRRVDRGLMLRAAPVVAVALCLTTCNSSPMVAPDGTILRLFANPTFIRADGGVSVISAQLVEPASTLVPDGTEVQFFTTLGKIDFTGKTKDGVARVNLVGDGHSGVARVSATSGLVENDNGDTGLEVRIGNKLPATVIVTADPGGVRPDQSSLITATVYDDDGNPAASVPITFVLSDVATAAVRAQSSYEYLQSAGQPRFTDASGRAFDFLFTTAGGRRKVLVTARTPIEAVTGDVTVTVN